VYLLDTFHCFIPLHQQFGFSVIHLFLNLYLKLGISHINQTMTVHYDTHCHDHWSWNSFFFCKTKLFYIRKTESLGDILVLDCLCDALTIYIYRLSLVPGTRERYSLYILSRNIFLILYIYSNGSNEHNSWFISKPWIRWSYNLLYNLPHTMKR
jgi:hypothetical protein